jgi:hypothetical protein
VVCFTLFGVNWRNSRIVPASSCSNRTASVFHSKQTHPTFCFCGCTNGSYLSPSGWVFQKLTVGQLVEKFPFHYGTRRFITVFTRIRHWSDPVETSPHPYSLCVRFIILCFHLHLALPSDSFLQLLNTVLYAFSTSSIHATRPTNLVLLDWYPW